MLDLYVFTISIPSHKPAQGNLVVPYPPHILQSYQMCIKVTGLATVPLTLTTLKIKLESVVCLKFVHWLPR